jgi:glycosyltransferase involved in cell wall biosynthesis
MKNILVVCDLGYGSPYWNDFSTYLSNENFKVTVLSPKMNIFQKKFLGVPYFPNYHLIQTKEFQMFYRKMHAYPRIIRFCIFIISKFLNFNLVQSENHHKWVTPAIQLAIKRNNKIKFDLVISTCLPIESHIIASEISKQLRIPWIADYRDPYSFNHTRLNAISSEEILWEKELLSNADVVTTTSLGFANLISNVFNGRIEIIQNGYAKVQKRKSRNNSVLQILYPGQIYPKFQKPEILLQALDKINYQSRFSGKVVVNFSGVSTGYISQYFKNLNQEIPNWVNLKKQFSLKKSISLQNKADLLLLLNWEDSGQKGVMQTKLYEYLASGTPILATGGFGNDETAEILHRSNVAVNLQDSTAVYNYLYNILESGFIPYDLNIEFLKELSREQQTKKLAGIINGFFI